MSNTLDTVFGDHPWANYNTNQRTVYVPELMEAYAHSSLYYRLVDYGVNLAAQRTGAMVFTRPIDPDPNIQTLGNRDLWLPRLFMDSQDITITAERHGGKIQLHKYDDMITYWTENGAAGLRAIMRKRLAPNMIATLDILARNAYIGHFAPMFAGTVSDFGALTGLNTFDPGIGRAVWLWADFTPDPVNNPVVGLISPAAVYTFKSGGQSTDWMGRLDYADPARLLNYEIGMYENVRYAAHPSNVLWNCGEIIHQSAIVTAVAQGDGCPDPASAVVDGVYATGQAAQTHHIAVLNANGYAAGDQITLHRTRNAAATTRGVQYGPAYNHYQNLDRRIVSVDTSANTITLHKPVLVDWYETAISGHPSTIYGWVTKARSVHVGTFVKGPRGVVAGVLQPPQTYTPRPIDDTESIFRFSWDAYQKYQIMNPERFEMYFYTGPQRRLGEVVTL